MTREKLRLTAALDVTARAMARLASSLNDDEVLLQSAVAAGDSATVDERRALDAFVQRFEQVFEHANQRLFTALYRVAEHGSRPPPPRQLLIYLNEVEIIASARAWAERAELRNRLIHEYPVEDAERAADLLAAITHGCAMLAELRAIEHLISERGYLNEMP